MADENKKLRITFHGRFIDHLGIQMYQSPVAAIAELIANAWDADATEVKVVLPDSVSDDGAVIVVQDTGNGMRYEECETRFLNIGACRRDDGDASPGGRPVLGRKGIGKFAGFGIARKITVDTTSKENGERTVFEMDLEQLRGNKYFEEGGELDVLEYEPPDQERAKKHGTIITLGELSLKRTISTDPFAVSMANRFLLRQRSADFKIFVNGEPLPEAAISKSAEFVFPRDYDASEVPEGVKMVEGGFWGEEEIDIPEHGRKLIRWQISFAEKPLEDDELVGISVFCRGKLAQVPFDFQMTGGSGQQGKEYMNGLVEADYLDDMGEDLISTDRQGINWEHPAAQPLLEWGQQRLKKLLALRRDRRGEERRKQIEAKIGPFAERLSKLSSTERKKAKRILTTVGGYSNVQDEQFGAIAFAILTAMEKGRLQELLEEMGSEEEISQERLLELLLEAEVLTALNIAEAVKTNLLAVAKLEKMVEGKELENDVRDHVAENPWLIDPKWQTYTRETSLDVILKRFAEEAGLDAEETEAEGGAGRKRIDLALASGQHLLVIEFMRPGLKVDEDHVGRFEKYVRLLRAYFKQQEGRTYTSVDGLMVAGEFHDAPNWLQDKIETLAKEQMLVQDWVTLIAHAQKQWKEFLEVLVARNPDDARLKDLLPAESPGKSE